MFNIEGRYLGNVFDSDSNTSEKDPQDLFEDVNQDDDQISVSCDGSVSLPNSDLNESADSIGSKEDEVEVDGNNNRSIPQLLYDSFYSISESIGCLAGKLLPENVFFNCYINYIIVRKIYVLFCRKM